MNSPEIVSAVARSFLAGEFSAEAATQRAIHTLGHPWNWIRPLAERYVNRFTSGHVPHPRHRDVVEFLLSDRMFRWALSRFRARLFVAHWVHEPQRMLPVAAARDWNLPVIETVGDLADFLSLYPFELEWFADLKQLNHRHSASPKLDHYHYRISPKRSGGFRLIEAPKQNLRDIQRRILARILDRVPAHPATHGFARGRSIRTFAAPHAGQAAVLRLDLDNFFPALPAARVQAIFRTFGYPEAVADRLAALCINSAPRRAWRERPADTPPHICSEYCILYARPHLPQGAPTSPALANIAAWRLDRRLSGLARAAAAVYTRYADDLAFSGGSEFARSAERFSTRAAAIALEEGFAINHRKTRIMRRGVQQHLAGVVINKKPSIARRDLDQLQAILTNCVRHGPESQNRAQHPNFRAYLEGRVAFVHMIAPAKSAPLRALLDQIAWP